MKMKRDTITGIVGIIAVIIFFGLTQMFKQVPNLIEPGPKMLPYVGLAVILLSSIMLLIQGLRDKSEEKPYFPEGEKKKAAQGYIALVIYGIAMTLVGFLITTPFAMTYFINMLKGDEKVKLWQMILISVVVTAALYAMFVFGFQVKLPSGILFK